jgi:peptide/nickel transport system permease protein
MYYLRICLQYAVTLLAALGLNFLLPRLAPGNPLNSLLGADVVEGMKPDELARVTRELGLDDPLPVQFWHYLTGLFHHDFGNSVLLGMPVWDALMQRLPWTLLLMGCALVAATLVGTLLGILSAWKRGALADAGIMGGVLFVGSLPPFWLAMMLIIAFSTTLNWLPSYGAYPVGTPAGSWPWIVGVARRLVMPATALAIVQAASILLIARASMMTALDQDYIMFARAKGASNLAIFFRHAFRNALLPLYTHVMMSLGALIGGALVIETVFSYPGLGSLVVMGVNSRDYPLLQGLFVIATLSIIAANLVTDLLYPLIDPRTRRAS